MIWEAIGEGDEREDEHEHSDWCTVVEVQQSAKYSTEGGGGPQRAHLIMNIQRHVVCSLMAPPRMGPSTIASMAANPTLARAPPYLGGGTDSRSTVALRVKHPPAPRP